MLVVASAVLFLGGGFRGWPQSKSGPARTAAPADRQAELQRLAEQGKEAMDRGDFEVAVQSFSELVRIDPSVAESQANLGLAYYSSGQPREAARALEQALKLKPALRNAHFFLGASLAEGGRCREALPYLEKDYPRADDRRLKRVIGLDALRCAMATNLTDRAVDFARLLGLDFPDDPDVLFYASHVYSDLSTRSSERLLAVAPASFQAHQLNGEVLELQGKLKEAEEEYRKVLSLNPRAPGVHYRLGRLALADSSGSSRLEEARREFEEELKTDPLSAPAEYELGEMARQARQWDQAIAHFSRAAEIDPEFAEAQIGLGRSLVAAGRAKDAVRPLENAVKLDPANPVAHYQLSFAYRRLGRDREADREIAAYRETFEKAKQQRERIREGILGRTGQQQTAEPPE